MKMRVRSILFAALLAIGASLPTKSHATYEDASYYLHLSEYYMALSTQSFWYAGIYNSPGHAANFVNYLTVVQNANSAAYNFALAAYTADSDPNGYYAQLYAYYALSNSYYANVYISYLAVDINYLVYYVNHAYLASYYASVAAYYSGLAS